MARLRWNQHPVGDDIDYRGPLTYRHFKIIGWMLLVLHLLVPLLQLGMSLDPFLTGTLAVPISILEILTPLSVFFLLIASMSQLITTGNYIKQMLTNGGATLGIILVFELIYHRYIVGTVDAFVGNRLESLSMINGVFSAINPAGFMTFNVFLDLFLCTTVLFFLNYEPQRFFVGERLKWFRCLVALPIIYELVCLWLKLMANSGDFHLPLSVFPFLTAKPPMMFFVFCAMVIYQATRERRFCADGRTHEEYQAFLGTNRDSWQFARFSAIVCLIAGTLDFIIVIVAVVGEISVNAEMLSTLSGDDLSLFFNGLVNKYINAGFGGSVDLLFLAPIMLLFNYRKTYKNTTIELAIPLVSIVALLFIYLEAGLIAMGMLAGIVKEEVMPQIVELMELFKETDDATDDMTDEDVDALLEELLGGEVVDGDRAGLLAEPPATEVPQAQEAPATEVPQAQEAPAETTPEPQQQPEPAMYEAAPTSSQQTTVQYEGPYYGQYYAEDVYDEAPQVEEALAPAYPEQQDVESLVPSETEQLAETANPSAPEQQATHAAETPVPDQWAAEPPAASDPERQAEYAAPSETERQEEHASLQNLE